MRIKRLLPPPSPSIWWVAATNLLGLLMPMIVAALATVGAYFPIGTHPAFAMLLNGYVVVLLGLGVSAIVLFGGPIYALLAWSWWPFVLSVLFGFSLIIGIALGLMVADALYDLGLKLFLRRSSVVINAILDYERLNGAPPTALTDLVPGQLTTVPSTGMSVDPDYEYEPRPGFCSAQNKWNLLIRLPGGFMSMDYLVYCPAQDYVALGPSDRLDMRGDWQYIRND
jgi:hypothetical protein